MPGHVVYYHSYNSCIFATRQLNSYTYLVVSPSFLDGYPVNLNESSKIASQRQSLEMYGRNADTNDFGRWPVGPFSGLDSDIYWKLCGDDCDRFRSGSTLLEPSFTNISKGECLLKYADDFGNRSDVILVRQKTISTRRNKTKSH